MNIYDRAYSRKYHSCFFRAVPGSETETGKAGMEMPPTTGFMGQPRETVKWKVILFHCFKELFEARNKLQKSHNLRRRKVTFPRTLRLQQPQQAPSLAVGSSLHPGCRVREVHQNQSRALHFHPSGPPRCRQAFISLQAKVHTWPELTTCKKAMLLPHPVLSPAVTGMEFVFMCWLLTPLQRQQACDDKWTQRLLVCKK